jgi:hypothetical protein
LQWAQPLQFLQARHGDAPTHLAIPGLASQHDDGTPPRSSLPARQIASGISQRRFRIGIDSKEWTSVVEASHPRPAR